MNYLSPEIEALSKEYEISNSLILTNISCGIFQNCEYDKKKRSIDLS